MGQAEGSQEAREGGLDEKVREGSYLPMYLPTYLRAPTMKVCLVVGLAQKREREKAVNGGKCVRTTIL